MLVARVGLDLDLVDLLDAVARVREAVRQRTVVRQQERARRVGVEATDRDDARSWRTRSTTVGRRCGSRAVVTTPAGLCSST